MAMNPEDANADPKPEKAKGQSAVEKMVDGKIKAFEAQLVADKRIQPAPGPVVVEPDSEPA